MGRLRDCILEILKSDGELTITQLRQKVSDRLSDIKPSSVSSQFYRELNKLVEDGFILRDGDRLKWTGKQPTPSSLPPTHYDVCFNCGDNLEGKLWHRCRNPNPPFTKHTKTVWVVRWGGKWLPVFQRFRRNEGKGRLRCEWCGADLMVTGVGFSLRPQFTMFPVQCPQCGKRFLAVIDLVAEGILR